MNLTALQFAVAALCVYRISLLFSKESGPARVFARLRNVPAKKSAAHEWLSCIFCFSMTSSAVVCGVLWWAGARQHPGHWFVTWCALSAAAIALNQVLTKGPLS
jgi:hypothetical protein